MGVVDGTYECEKHLTSNRQSPGNLAADVRHAVIKEVTDRLVSSDKATWREKYLITIPTPTSNGSLQTNFPLFEASQSSACHMGTVDVSIPVPIPQRKRPTIICGTL